MARKRADELQGQIYEPNNPMSDPSPFVQWTFAGLAGVIALIEMYIRDGGTISKERKLTFDDLIRKMENIKWKIHQTTNPNTEDPS